MKPSTLGIALGVGIACAATLGGVALALRPRERSPASTTAPRATRYSCPMHPDCVSDEPGSCPVCSMKLVPVDAEPPTLEASAAPGVRISPERQQQIGVRFARVERVPAAREIRATGKVAFDETQIAHVHSKVSGWIEEVYVDYVGAPVRQGEPLFAIYSPDLVASQQEYLLALRARDELGSSSFARIAEGSRSLVDTARRRLELWDMSPERWEEGGRRGDPRRVIVDAVKEVGGPAFFSLLVIALAFVPIFALQAQEGRLFKPLAFTKNAAMAVAALLAITLDPVLRLSVARVEPFRFRPRPLAALATRVMAGRIEREEDSRLSRALMSAYLPALLFVLRRPALTLGVAGLLMASLIALLGVDAETGVFMLLYLDLAYRKARAEGRLRDVGQLREAVIEGAVKRLRPKVMTATVMFMGLVPILWSSGAGSDVMQRIAAPMVGGIFSSFALELLVYPVLYELWKMWELPRESAS